MEENTGQMRSRFANLSTAAILHLQLVGGRAGIDRAVEAVYIGDHDDPTPWMLRGSLLLTTGPKLEAEPSSGPRLVQLLKKGGMVGVGVGIAPHVREIPRGMVAASDAAGFPLLRVPEDTPFRLIASYVYNALASRDMHRLRRGLALEQQLLEVALVERSPVATVRRLGDLTDTNTALLDANGAVVGSGFSLFQDGGQSSFVRAVWEEYSRIRTGSTRSSIMEVQGCPVAFREVDAPGGRRQLLVAAYATGSLISEFSDVTLTFAQHLLELQLATNDNIESTRRRTRPGLLDMLVHRRGNLAELSECLVSHCLDPSDSWCVVAVWAELPSRARSVSSDSPPAAPLGDSLLAFLDPMFEDRGIPFLSQSSGDHVLLLTPVGPVADADTGGERLFEIGKVLAERLGSPSLIIAASEPFTGLDGVPRAAEQARLALRCARVVGRPAIHAVRFENLDIRHRALAYLPDDVLRQFEEHVLGPLRAIDGESGSDLVGTLDSFLAHGCAVSDTAVALYLHRNTLRRRLARIEQVLAVDLSTVAGQVETYLGVHAAEVLAARQE